MDLLAPKLDPQLFLSIAQDIDRCPNREVFKASWQSRTNSQQEAELHDQFFRATVAPPLEPLKSIYDQYGPLIYSTKWWKKVRVLVYLMAYQIALDEEDSEGLRKKDPNAGD